MPILRIVRGLPGSGKSTHAKSFGTFHVEADMLLVVDGVYSWSPERVTMAHGWCKRMVATAIKSGMDVTVSNTFTRVWEFREYIDIAKESEYTIEIISCVADYGNVHNVPAESIAKMRKRWEEFDGEIIYNSQN